jgi:hypothetical protein
VRIELTYQLRSIPRCDGHTRMSGFGNLSS